MERIPGAVDFRDDQFVVSCQFDGRVHAQLRALPRNAYDRGVWLIPCHLKSVAGLVAVARQHDWPITAYAEQALSEIRAAAEIAECRVELVHGPAGEPWFKCRADDSEMEDTLDALPGAERDDEPNTWLVSTTSPDACEAVRALVDSDPRFEIDPAARRLLDSPEDWPELVRTETEEEPAPEPVARVRVAPPKTVHEVTAAFDREQELLAWSSAVIADAPDGPLEAQLRPYQRAGVRYLRSAGRAFLADDKGLGKSVQALAAIEAEAAYPALILCSAARELQWESEIGLRLNHERTCTIVDASVGSIPGTDIVIANYDVLYKRRDELKIRGFNSIVADDSFQLKNERALRTRAALEISETVQGLRFCLSSTALFEQPIELLPQLLFLGHVDGLQGRNSFVERYCRPRHDVAGTRYGASHVAELEQRLRASCLCRREASRVAAQISSPPRYNQVVRTQCSSLQRDREAILVSELRFLHERATETSGAAAREAYYQQGRACFAELCLLAANSKLEGIVEWIDHFMLTGDWLAVVVSTPALMVEFERRYKDAVFVGEHGSCVQGGKTVNAFFAADAKLVFIEDGASGDALRMARGRHVAIAEPAARPASHGISEFLLDSKSGEQAGAIWALVSDMATDRPLQDAPLSAAASNGEAHTEWAARASASEQLGSPTTRATAGGSCTPRAG